MLSMDDIGYFLAMEQMEQEQRDLESLRKVVLEGATDLDLLLPPPVDKSE